jgi:dTDP-4-amino-4,6-dideoxygalactose transaminase
MADVKVSQLGILGGKPAVTSKIAHHNPIGIREQISVNKVLRTGVLSKFLGTWSADFYGGPKVIEFELAASKMFGSKYAVSVNSWTSGLIAAVGAVGITPGDEVIVTPWSMSASIAAVLHWGGIPIFADIDAKDFNINPAEVRKLVGPRTKAILAADIFGKSANLNDLMTIAAEFNLKVISDTAQSPGSKTLGKFSGTVAHIGGISLNYHKHIHTGEGGLLFTNDDELAFRMQLIRNHAESIVASADVSNISNLIGYNFRMGEIEAAIGIEQLTKLERIIKNKQFLANRLTKELTGLTGIVLPEIDSNLNNVYYVYPIILDPSLIGVSRRVIVSALRAEGVPGLSEGYQNLHLLPVFQQKIAFGNQGFPWNQASDSSNSYNYSKGICPVAESYHDERFIGFGITGLALKSKHISEIGMAFKKVWGNLDQLATIGD